MINKHNIDIYHIKYYSLICFVECEDGVGGELVVGNRLVVGYSIEVGDLLLLLHIVRILVCFTTIDCS